MASNCLATSGEEEKKKKLAPPPPPSTHAPELDQKMFECTVSPPHRLTREQQGTTIPLDQEFAPRARLSFVTSELASSPGNGNTANLNPFAGNFGETVRTDSPPKTTRGSRRGMDLPRQKKDARQVTLPSARPN